MEDVTDIILNVKTLVVRLDSDEPKTMVLEKSAAGEMTAGDIKADSAITVLNPDQVIATLTDDKPFRMEMTVARGRGYLLLGDQQ